MAADEYVIVTDDEDEEAVQAAIKINLIHLHLQQLEWLHYLHVLNQTHSFNNYR